MPIVSGSAAKKTLSCCGYFSGKPYDSPCWISFENGRISAIEDKAPEGNGAEIEEDPLYAVPLLADTHVHVYMDPWPLDAARRVKPGSQAFEVEVENALRRVRKALRQGIGFLRDMGDPYGINLEVKRRLKASGELAPEILVPGPAIHRPKKYGRFLGIKRETLPEILDTIDSLCEESKIDYIKVVATGIVDFDEVKVKQAPQFETDELAAVVAHADDKGLKVAAHCSGEDGLERTIDAGVQFIEHAYFINDDQIERLAAKGLGWTPTFAPVYAQGTFDECGWPRDTRSNIAEILERHAGKLGHAFELGTRILAGTDAGSPGVEMGEGLRMELSCMAKSGLSASELLSIATEQNASSCGARSYTGLLEPGMPASFGLYSKSPWEDIQNLDTLKFVYADGTLLC